MLGQFITPDRYDPLADVREAGDVRRHLTAMRKVVADTVAAMPSQREFIARTCRAEPIR
jgi:tryptophan halogenase